MGAGFVGACSAAVSADSGHSVMAFDINQERINSLSSGDPEVIKGCLHEEGLAELILQHRSKLSFTTDMKALTLAMDSVDAIFMCLPTPERENGESDLSYFRNASTMLAELMAARNGGTQSKRILIINKSTVPIRTVDLTREILDSYGVVNYGVASNPEFLVEGQAVYDSIHPKRVVVGAETDADFSTLRKIYQRFYDSSNVVYQEMNPYEAATVKLISNTALFNRLAYTFAVAGRVCELYPELSYEQIRKGIISDSRIGKWGFYDSLYAGGSCLIKDAMSLAFQIEEEGGDPAFIRAILDANAGQIERFYNRAEEEAGVDFNGKTVALLGLSFKQGTNDMRHSGALYLIRNLLGAGVASLRAFDPAAMDACRALFDPEKESLYKKILYCKNEEEALQSADVVFVITDWPEFRTLADTMLEVSRPCLLMDGRRILSHRYVDLVEKGFSVIAVGSSFIKGKEV